ncbi:Adaptive-response sensory-kinase SasA [Candidatus Lokiarchaeum ossiferum]
MSMDIEDYHQNMKQIKLICEDLPFPILIVDSGEHCIFINHHFINVIKYSLDDIPILQTWNSIALLDQNSDIKAFKHSQKYKSPHNKLKILKIRCKDQRIRNFIIQNVEIFKEFTIFFFIDPALLLEIEMKTSLTEAYLHKMIEEFPLPIVLTDKEDVVEYINPAFSKMFGYTQEDIKSNDDWGRLAYPDPAYFEKIRNQREYLDLNNARIRERLVNCKDGSKKYIINQDIFIDNKRELTISLDITKLRRIEEAKKQQDILFEQMIENAQDIIILLTLEGIIISINPACNHILQYSQKEMMGKNSNDFVSEKHRNFTDQQALAKIQGKKKKTRYSVDMIRKDGSICNMEVSSSIIYKDNQPHRIQAILRDVTELRKISAESHRNERVESISLLAGGIAHDFNNILSAILGNINLLQIESDEQEKIEIINDLENATLQARNLTQQLLSFSKGGTPIKNVSSLEDLVVKSAHFVLRGTNIQSEINLCENLPQISFDEGQIYQVLNNILINAIQAMENGGMITLSTERVTIDKNNYFPIPEGEYALIKIKDTGIGISPEEQKRIFDPYFTTKATGSGLGLTSCYSIIKNHNGYLTFESELNRGTTFFIYLPIVLV